MPGRQQGSLPLSFHCQKSARDFVWCFLKTSQPPFQRTVETSGACGSRLYYSAKTLLSHYLRLGNRFPNLR